MSKVLVIILMVCLLFAHQTISLAQDPDKPKLDPLLTDEEVQEIQQIRKEAEAAVWDAELEQQKAEADAEAIRIEVEKEAELARKKAIEDADKAIVELEKDIQRIKLKPPRP